MILPALMVAACAPKQGKAPIFDPADMDLSVAPGENFYKYVNGGWQVNHPLKAEYSRYGAFDVVREANEIRLNDLFKSMSDMKTETGTVEQKITDLYKQGLDSTRLNAEGNTPILKYVQAVYDTKNKTELTKQLAALTLTGDGSFFASGVEADLMDSNSQILWLMQGGLGMGDRDYYLEPSMAELKKGYRDMLVKLFTLTGIADAEKAADNTLYIEDKLAKASWTSVENRNYAKLYNPMSSAQVAASFPGFDFATYMAECGVAPQPVILVGQPSFFKAFSSLYAKTDLKVLQDYVVAHLIQGATSALSDEYYTASFDFFSRQMSGVTEQKPRWKRAMGVPNSILGEAVGQMYVEKYFPESYKQRVLTLVENVRAAFSEHIDSLDWMGEQTKAYAQDKLAAFTVKIGYPDQWKDYSTLVVDPELSYYENLRAANAWYIQDNLSKLGKPTDKTEWGMTPQTVNAYYNPTTNEICFPAAILQPPFFNPEADDAVNYGAIGVVICHEMSHGFDDQGRMFDKEGNMNSWWTAEDDAAFKAKADVLAAQFDEVVIIPAEVDSLGNEVKPALMANGRLSLGENIADHGGISIAYTALQNSFAGKHPEKVEGFTAEQRFFMGYAHVWAQNITHEEEARLTKLDVHSLGLNRVNVTLRNFGEFFDAFGIKEGDAMWRPESDRVRIW